MDALSVVWEDTETARVALASMTLPSRTELPRSLTGCGTASSILNGGQAYTILIPDHGTDMASTNLALWSGNGDAGSIARTIHEVWRHKDLSLNRISMEIMCNNLIWLLTQTDIYHNTKYISMNYNIAWSIRNELLSSK